MIGTGDVGDQGAERDDHLDAEAIRDLGDPVRESPPLQVRFGSGEEEKIAYRAFGGGGEEHVSGPLNLARLALSQVDRRPVGLEVEELLWIDLCDHLGVQRFGGSGEGGGRRTRRIVPPGEGADQDR